MNKDNHKMMADWDSIGRVVIKNSKGIYLKGDGLYFHINDTVLNIDLARIFLEKKRKEEEAEKKRKLDFLMGDKTKSEWNAIGYIVKKGSTGVYSKSKKTILFSFYDTFINKPLAKKFLRQHQYYFKKKEMEREQRRERKSTKVRKEFISDTLF